MKKGGPKVRLFSCPAVGICMPHSSVVGFTLCVRLTVQGYEKKGTSQNVFSEPCKKKRGVPEYFRTPFFNAVSDAYFSIPMYSPSTGSNFTPYQCEGSPMVFLMVARVKSAAIFALSNFDLSCIRAPTKLAAYTSPVP